MIAPITIESAAIRLTDTILGYNEQDLEQTLKAIAADIGVVTSPICDLLRTRVRTPAC